MSNRASPFAGVWDVLDATLPSGAFAYTGTITVDALAETFALDWDITAGRYVGIGLLAGDHLFVSCGEQLAGLGLALYRAAPDGSVAVEWCAGEQPGLRGGGRFTTSWDGTFEGEHDVAYTLPDGRAYGAWTLVARRVGQVYDLSWRKGGQQHFQGIGLEMEGGLAVSWYPDRAQLAFLDYTLDPGDGRRLAARWALADGGALGTETLARR